MLHGLAFSNSAVQLTAADMENALYGGKYRHISARAPIFVTSLPRAGTTLTLEILSGHPNLASHCYRDMPFVMAPLLWDAISRRFRKPSGLKERAHHDGMLVGYDSPEAFEEIFWRSFWPGKFKDDRIELWSKDEDAGEFHEFFSEHMKKIIALRATGVERARYVSKNNANVARLSLLKRLFPDGVILVPFRHPVNQAVSLQKQHLRFMERHRADPFSKRYMNDIGHLEFGELHRPIHFDGVEEILGRRDPRTLEYWLSYWICGFRHIARHSKDVVLFSYEKLCEAGSEGVRTMVASLGITPSESGDSAGPGLHEARGYGEQAAAVDRDLLKQAAGLHEQLLSLSIV
jgi:hypothetical protein